MIDDKSDVEYEDDLPMLETDGIPFSLILAGLIVASLATWFLWPQNKQCYSQHEDLRCSIVGDTITIIDARNNEFVMEIR